jgi:hypothetical protein
MKGTELDLDLSVALERQGLDLTVLFPHSPIPYSRSLLASCKVHGALPVGTTAPYALIYALHFKSQNCGG